MNDLIQLTDDEILAVAGGGGARASAASAVGIAQRISQHADVAQLGGYISIGGSGVTTVTGSTTLSETFTSSISQSATNTNSGSVTATTTTTASAS